MNKKKEKHSDDLPFIEVLNKKELSIFLSNTQNDNKTHHLLVIPREHYEFIENMPSKIIEIIIKYAILASKILKEKYGGSNIILNNGFSAGQYIPHVHFHIIPKDLQANNPWKNLDIQKFEALSSELKKMFENQNL